jgi:hypothetical protein
MSGIVISINQGVTYNADGRATVLVDEDKAPAIAAQSWVLGNDPSLQTQWSQWDSTFTLPAPDGRTLQQFVLGVSASTLVKFLNGPQDFRASSLAVVAS